MSSTFLANQTLRDLWVQQSKGAIPVHFPDWIALLQNDPNILIHDQAPVLNEPLSMIQPWLRRVIYAFGLLYPYSKLHVSEIDALGMNSTQPPLLQPNLHTGFHLLPRCEELSIFQYAQEHLIGDWCYLDIQSTFMQISYEGTHVDKGCALGINANDRPQLMQFDVGKSHARQHWIDLLTGREVMISDQGTFQHAVPAGGLVLFAPVAHRHKRFNRIISPSHVVHLLIPAHEAPSSITVKPHAYAISYEIKPTCTIDDYVQFSFPIGYSFSADVSIHEKTHLVYPGSFELRDDSLHFSSISPQRVVMLFYVGPIYNPILHYRKAMDSHWQDQETIGFNGRYAYVALPIGDAAGIEFVWRSSFGMWDHPGMNLRANYGVYKYNTHTWGRWVYQDAYHDCVEDFLDVDELFRSGTT